MKYRGIIIIVEGHSEEVFVNESLRPWFMEHGIYDVRAIKIQTSRSVKGGNINYANFKNDVMKLMRSEKDVLITSLIDLFRLPNEFPSYQDAQKIMDIHVKVEFLEQELAKDISSNRFIPYIQLHEFEALLFTDIRGFMDICRSQSEIDQIQDIIDNYPNPELINENPQTSPSKRLDKIFSIRFNKVLFGNYIILENSFPSLLAKCPRFSHWLNKIINEMKV